MTEGKVTDIQMARSFFSGREEKYDFVGVYLNQEDEEIGRFRKTLTISEAVDFLASFVFDDTHVFVSPRKPKGGSLELVNEFSAGVYIECHEESIIDAVASRLKAMKKEVGYY